MITITRCAPAFLLAFQIASASEPVVFSGGIGVISDQCREWEEATLRLENATGDLQGSLQTEFDRVYQVSGTRAGDSIRIALGDGDSSRWFSGQLRNETLTATADDDKLPKTIVVRRVELLTSAQIDRIAGTYSFDDGQRITFRPANGGLAMDDYGKGLLRTLYAISEDSFVAGSAIAVPDQVGFRVQFERDTHGEVDRVRLTGGDYGNVIAMRRPGPTIEDFEYESFDGTVIRGSLYTPAGSGPHPAVVWVHGSGEATRARSGHWPYYFSDLGFAVLAVDKRGVGQSEGTYRLPGRGGSDNFPHMRRRSRDVAAAVKALNARPDILANRVGLVGGSQAGWVIPMTVGQVEISFAVILSGGATPLSIEARFSRMASEESSSADLRPVAELVEELRAYQPTDNGIDVELSQLDFPCLWLYGLKDRSNPSQLCAERIERIGDQYRRDFEVRLFPDGNHALLKCQFGGGAEMAALDRLVPDLHKIIAAWLEDKNLLPSNQP